MKHLDYWLLGLIAALGSIYMALLWRADDTAHFGMSCVFGLAIANNLWERRDRLLVKPDWRMAAIGGLFVAIGLGLGILPVSFVPQNTGYFLPGSYFLRPMPVVLGLGVCLIAAGWRGLKQYWQEITLLFFLGVPSLLASTLPDISPLTAKFSAYLLWYAGFDVVLKDVYIYLPKGAVEVYGGCSGMESMVYLLGISVLCLFLFPIAGIKRFFVPVLAMSIAYACNALRVAGLALLAAPENKAQFDFWHDGNGSLVVGSIAILIFVAVHFLMTKQDENHAKVRAAEAKVETKHSLGD